MGQPNPAEAVETRGVSKYFGKFPAVENITMSCAKGRITALVGPNGCGKTTTLEIMAGLAKPTAGHVYICGKEPREATRAGLVAFVPDTPVGLSELTVAEYVGMYCQMFRRPESVALGHEILTLFHLNDRLDARLSGLSSGMRRQVSIAASVAIQPEVLFVDEATATLDPEAVVVLRELLKETAKAGGCVVLATQDLAFAESAADDVSMLVDGELVVSGPMESVRRDGSLEAAFLWWAKRGDVVSEVRRVFAT